MNTSKSIDDTLHRLWVKAVSNGSPDYNYEALLEAKQAIVEAVEGLINVADSNCMDCNDLARLRQTIKEWQ